LKQKTNRSEKSEKTRSDKLGFPRRRAPVLRQRPDLEGRVGQAGQTPVGRPDGGRVHTDLADFVGLANDRGTVDAKDDQVG